MKIQTANRMSSFSASIFSEMAAYKAKKIKEGKNIIDLSIGSPDLPPPSFVMEAISQHSMNDQLYGYSMRGTNEFQQAVQTYYRDTYHVTLDSEKEIFQLMGSQDGLVHLPMVIANPGDIVLVPDPGYTAYATGIAMAEAIPYFMPLQKENHFLPDFSKIPEDIATQATIMILNFPGNPIPVMATEQIFVEAIAFAKKYNIMILHDFAYSELYYGNEAPISFLAIEGSQEVGVEFNSLSKSFNMAGCRVAYALGNEKIITALKQLKSNLDYGVFLPIQHAATLALQKGSSFTEEARSIYRKRRECLVNGLSEIGWNIETPQAGMFIWAEIPNKWTSKQFAFELTDHAGVTVTPGIAFGPSGEGFVRIALVENEDSLQQAVKNIRDSGMFL